jgi:FAD/FMN-containing dehydrogenase
MITTASDYEARKTRLSEQMRRANGARLGKRTSNLFRGREKASQESLGVRDFNHVLAVNIEEGWADVEGMTTYEDFTDETLKYGYMPSVVPQLKTITVGGAVAGVGIEATSFRYGLVHETVLEMEILLATGEVVVCNAREHADLFYGFPNSYGTFGYALRLRVKMIPVKPFVKIAHTRYEDPELYFHALKKTCGAAGVDFVDGAMFGPAEMYIVAGTFIDTAPFVSDYTYRNIYYKSIRERNEDYLSARDFIWRWDTDWFWCSKVIGAQNSVMRRLLGPKRLNSAFYGKLMRLDQRWGFGKKLSSLFGKREEWVIQDVDIPIEHAPAFAQFFFREINIRPVWICPIGAYDQAATFALYPLDPQKLYVNFGFWDAVPSEKEYGHYNKLVEAKVSELQGRKGLYSDSFYTAEVFWKMYDKSLYDSLKKKYDPQGKLKDLFQKCVERQ